MSGALASNQENNGSSPFSLPSRPAATALLLLSSFFPLPSALVLGSSHLDRACLSLLASLPPLFASLPPAGTEANTPSQPLAVVQKASFRDLWRLFL